MGILNLYLFPYILYTVYIINTFNCNKCEFFLWILLLFQTLNVYSILESVSYSVISSFGLSIHAISNSIRITTDIIETTLLSK